MNPILTTFMRECRVESCCVWENGLFSRKVTPAMTEQHLLIKTRSTEYRKIQQERNKKNYSDQKMVNLSYSTQSGNRSYIYETMCTLCRRRTPVENQLGPWWPIVRWPFVRTSL